MFMWITHFGSNLKFLNEFLNLVLILILSFGAINFGTGIVFATEVLPVPVISVNPDIYYPFDEIIYIEGRALPNSTVQIQFQKQGAKLLKFNSKSDANGEWVLAEKIPLESGDWEIRARFLAGPDKISEWSNPRVFKVIVSGVTIGGINIKFAFLTFTLLVVLFAAASIFFYFRYKVKQLKAVIISKEIKEARDSVKDGLSEIRKDLIDELKIMESSVKTLSAEELSRKEHLLRELDLLERNMDKEIQDIKAVDN